MKNKKYLYCPHCRFYPDLVLERYRQEINVLRKWDGETYEEQSNNLNIAKSELRCHKCGRKLLEIYEKN